VYIPLGGNKGSKLNWLRNILIVWFITGFWHGANWNFIIWGLYFGILLMAEKMFLQKLLDKIPRIFGHVYVILIVVISFVIFNNESLLAISTNLKGMFGLGAIPFSNSETVYYLRSYIVLFIIGAIAATPLLGSIYKKITHEKSKKIINIGQIAVLAILMVIVTGYIVDSSFNPFLYFRF
jgi:alginate O-acetyltransferase complex protein AlgI